MAKLKYLVIHCTATPSGREVSSNEIRAWHTNPVCKGGRGWKQVGYTDLIHLNGEVERLVANNEDANVDPWEITNGAKGYNSVSRHIVYVGGVAADGKTTKDTRTKEQKRCDGHSPWGGFPAPPRQGAEHVCCLAHSELFTEALSRRRVQRILS